MKSKAFCKIRYGLNPSPIKEKRVMSVWGALAFSAHSSIAVLSKTFRTITN